MSLVALFAAFQVWILVPKSKVDRDVKLPMKNPMDPKTKQFALSVAAYVCLVALCVPIMVRLGPVIQDRFDLVFVLVQFLAFCVVNLWVISRPSKPATPNETDKHRPLCAVNPSSVLK